MAGHASFAERFVFEGKRSGLLAVALRAGFVQSRHRQSSGGFEDIASMGIVALRAVHVILDQGMVIGQLELGLNVEVTLKTGGWVFARVRNELPSSASGRDMFAARSMAGFATRHPGPFQIVPVQPPVRACRKKARDVCVTIDAGAVSNEHGAVDLRRFNSRAGER